MDRITPKEVLSMMDAVAQVYDQPEKDQVDEKQEEDQVDEAYSQSERKSARDQLSKIPPSTPNYASMSDEEFKKLLDKSGNPEGLSAKRKNQQAAAAKNTVPAGSFNISPKGSDRRNEVEAQIKKDNAARTDDQLVEPKTAPKPELTDQQKVRAEYDRLRYSKDPKERAQAAGYGKAMASAGAAKKDFSGYKSAADLAKSNSDKSGTISGIMGNKSASGSGPGGYQTSASAKPTVVTPASSRETSGAYKPPVDKPTTPAAAKPVASTPRMGARNAMRAPGGIYGGRPAPVTPASKPATPVVKPKPAINSNQQSSLNNTVQSATGGSNIRARLDAIRQRAIQNAPASAQGMLRDIESRRMRMRNQAAGRLGDPMIVTTGSGSNATTKTYAAGTPKSNPEVKSTIDSARNLIKKGSGIPTGKNIKTKVNPDSSIQVTQKRDPKETAKIKRSLDF